MTHPIDKHVGQKTRTLRVIRGMTQQQLAEKIGVKFQQVQKYETGANRISSSRLYEIANALEVPIKDFFPDAGTAGDTQIIDPRLFQISRQLTKMTEDQAQSFANIMTATASTILLHSQPASIAAE